MNNLKTIRELRKVVEHTQNLIDDLIPEVNVTQIDSFSQFELGTRYRSPDGSVFRYVKIVSGPHGRHYCRWI